VSSDFPESDDLEYQVVYLSRVVREVLSWMDAAELSGSVPDGLRARVRDQDELDGILLHIKSIRETLDLLESNGDMGTVQDRLRESLAEMEATAQELKGRLSEEA
jgi:hypothetical protein